MKFYYLFVVGIVLIVLFSGCSNSSNIENTTFKDIEKQTSTIEKETFDSITDNSDLDQITQISVEILGTKKLLSINDELIQYINKSKTINKPKIKDLSLTKVGDVYITEKEKKEYHFGEIYSDYSGKYYLHALENQHKAVIQIKPDNV